MKTENKLIAEFMGMEKERHSDGRYLFTTDLEEAKGIDTRFTEELYFHISWDWLMPVHKKCMHTKQFVGDDQLRTLLIDAVIDADKSRLYNAVVEFIIEYNKIK